MQGLLFALSNNANMFRMCFSPSQCKISLQYWSESTPEQTIGSKIVVCRPLHFFWKSQQPCWVGSWENLNMDSESSVFFYQLALFVALVRCKSTNRRTSILRNSPLYITLWSWNSRTVEGMYTLQVLDHNCLPIIGCISWNSQEGNVGVRRSRTIGSWGCEPTDVLPMPNNDLHRWTTSDGVGVDRENARGVQIKRVRSVYKVINCWSTLCLQMQVSWLGTAQWLLPVVVEFVWHGSESVKTPQISIPFVFY